MHAWTCLFLPANQQSATTSPMPAVTSLAVFPAGASACTWSFADPSSYQDGYQSTTDCGAQLFLTSPAQQFGSTCPRPTTLISDSDGVWLNPATVCSIGGSVEGQPNRFNLSATAAVTITTLVYGWRDPRPDLPVSAILTCPGGRFG
ncbi:hypothetical protein ABPG77_002179 [Micractinium sp. CCAP 211/92]